MADPPAAIPIAIATLGSFDASNVVMGSAVGQPMPSSRRAAAQSTASASAAPSDVPIAQGFLYSPHMAKLFAQFDTSSTGCDDASTRMPHTAISTS